MDVRRRRGVQTLKRLICLCTDCHTVTHYGYAQVRGVEAQAFAHLMMVTRMSPARAREHIAAAFEVWERRSRIAWELDLGILTGAGITLAPPPGATDRARVSDAVLRVEGRPVVPRQHPGTGRVERR